MTSDSSGDIDSATQAARAAVDAADLRTPDLPWIAERPPRRHAHTLVACAAAMALHGGVVAALWFGIPYDPEDIGGNGLGRDAIGIDIIDNQVLAALRLETIINPGAANSMATTQGVAIPEVARVETIDATATKADAANAAIKPDIVVPEFVERPEPPTADTISIAQLAPLLEPLAAPKEDPTAAKPTASAAAAQVASTPAPAAVAAVQGGSVTQSAATVADVGQNPAQASAGVAKAFGQSVMAALVTTQPQPRPGLGTGTAGWLRGTVVIDFTLALDGSIANSRVASSSGHRELDQAALDAVRRTRFPKPPSSLPSNERQYIMPYYFR